MAFIAVRTKVAVMYIVAVMAIDTTNISLIMFYQGLYMATMAVQSVVRPFYLEISLVVVKFPNQPVVWIVALLTFLSQCPLMDIVIVVAVITF